MPFILSLALLGQPPQQTASLFLPGDEAVLIARRTVRLAMLPPAPAVPDQTDAGPNPIDRFLLATIRAADPDAPPWIPCDDAAFLRRVYLDVIGVGPTLAEQERFFNDPSPNRRTRLIDELLLRNSDWADHWTSFWEDALASAPAPSTGGMTSRGNSTSFINAAFRENRPFDVFVAQLIDPSLPGHYKPQQGSDNGRSLRAHLVLNETHDDRLSTAAVVSQVFLGTAMKCAACHDHFENDEWSQERFLGFASFFGRGDMEVIRCEKRQGRTVGPSFPFAVPGAPADTPADESGRLTRVAQLITDPFNERFCGSIVNRLWKRYLGLGLIEPADDWRDQWPPSHPGLLAWLANDFAVHGYDLKRTTRLILTSRAYQASYNPLIEDVADSEFGEPRLYRSPTLRRLTAEQLIDSVRLSLNQRLDPSSRLFRSPESTNLSRVLGKAALRNEVVTGRSADTPVVQGLELLNGEQWAGLVKSGPLLQKAIDSGGPAQSADLLYRATLCRAPSTEEREAMVAFLGPDPTAEGLHDVLWAIVTGPEFQYLR